MRLAGVIREGNLFDQPGSREPGRGPARVLWPARYRALLETKRKVSVSAARPAAMFITSFLMMRVPWIAGATGTHRIILQLSAQMVRLICRLSKGQFVPWSSRPEARLGPRPVETPPHLACLGDELSPPRAHSAGRRTAWYRHPGGSPRSVRYRARSDILDGILKVQQQQMKVAGLLQGSGGKGAGSGESDEDVIVRIKADARCFGPMSRCRQARCPRSRHLIGGMMRASGAVSRTRSCALDSS